jgi:hypothetical protein
MRWASHGDHMVMRSRYKILVRKTEGKRELERPEHRQEVNIKIYLKEIDYEVVE